VDAFLAIAEEFQAIAQRYADTDEELAKTVKSVAVG
jgi:hypothetical protein